MPLVAESRKAQRQHPNQKEGGRGEEEEEAAVELIN